MLDPDGDVLHVFFKHWRNYVAHSIDRACRKVAADYTEDGKPIWSREYETRRVTIELNSSRSIVQVRGPLNRPPSGEEQQVLRRWMGERGVQAASRENTWY